MKGEPEFDAELLGIIADQIDYWLGYQKGERDKEGLETTSATHVMNNGYQNAPPEWPSRRVLQNWSNVLRGRPVQP